MMTEIPFEDKDEATPSSDTNVNINWRTRTAAALYRRRRYLEAQQEARELEAAQTQALQQQQQQQQKEKSRLSRRLASVGNALQKINIGRWIDDLERDQELADHLDQINQDTREEAARMAICRQAQAACRDAMRDHLMSFVQEHGYDETQEGATYEDWIRDLHPDNVLEETESSQQHRPPIDKRFFIPDCDYIVLWKEVHDHTKKETQGGEEEDLVEEDLSGTAADKQNNADNENDNVQPATTTATATKFKTSGDK